MLAARGEARARHGADDHRHAGLAARHEAQLGGMVEDHVHRDRDEVHQHDLGHRLIPAHGCANRCADNRLFGYGRGFDALFAEAGR